MRSRRRWCGRSAKRRKSDGRPEHGPACMDSRRLAYLKALEIDLWARRTLPAPSGGRVAAADVTAGEATGTAPGSASPATIGARVAPERSRGHVAPAGPTLSPAASTPASQGSEV